MKKLIFACLLLIGGASFAQDMANEQEVDVETGTVWEIKGNAFYLVLGALEVSVEHSLNSESAIGVSGFLPFDKEVKESIEYYVAPYYRLYFGEKYTAGFFLEGFAMLNSTERTQFESIFEEREDEFVTDLAIGIGLGGKWVTRNGFVGEINFGIGRNLFSTADNDIEVVGKGGIVVGYRF